MLQLIFPSAGCGAASKFLSASPMARGITGIVGWTAKEYWILRKLTGYSVHHSFVQVELHRCRKGPRFFGGSPTPSLQIGVFFHVLSILMLDV